MNRTLFFLVLLSLACPISMAQSHDQRTAETTLRTAQLTGHMRDDILAVLVKELKDLDPEISNPQDVALESGVSDIKLARTGPPVLLVTSGSDHPATGATGNHEIWLFRRIGNHAVLLLRSGGAMYGPASKTYHFGMLDFKAYGKMGSGEGSTEVFRFEGKRYRSIYCYQVTWENNGVKEVDGPHEPCAAK